MILLFLTNTALAFLFDQGVAPKEVIVIPLSTDLYRSAKTSLLSVPPQKNIVSTPPISRHAKLPSSLAPESVPPENCPSLCSCNLKIIIIYQMLSLMLPSLHQD